MKNMKLIKTQDYLLFIDEEAEIKGSPFLCYNPLKITWDDDVVLYQGAMPEYNYRGLQKIIAYYPLNSEAKELDLPLLPNPFNKQIDEVTYLKNLGHECFIQMKELNPSGGIKEFIRMAVEFGYKAAQSKQLELLKRAIQLASDAENIEEVTEEIIQSLSTQQSKLPVNFIPEFEQDFSNRSCSNCNLNIAEGKCEEGLEKKCVTATGNEKHGDYWLSCLDDEEDAEIYKLKTITNSEGKEEIVGTYKYNTKKS